MPYWIIKVLILDKCPVFVYNILRPLCKVKRCITLLLRAIIIMEQLSQKVKELRKRKGWAQEDMAREIGVSLSTVQRWERQGGRPSRLARRELLRLFAEAGIEWNKDPGRKG